MTFNQLKISTLLAVVISVNFAAAEYPSKPARPSGFQPSTSTQNPASSPTPYPTPVVDLASYLPRVDPHAPTIEVIGTSTDEELGEKIRAASNVLDQRVAPPKKGIIAIRGKGRVRIRPIVNHHMIFAKGLELYADQQDSDMGTFLLKNGVSVEFLEGAKIYEPTYNKIEVNGTRNPAIAIFQSYEDSLYRSVQHEGLAHNIAIIRPTIIGRQRVGDGGTRCAIQFGNIHTAAVIQGRFFNLAALGVCYGGYAGAGNYARHVLSYYNYFEGLTGAHEALVNVDDAIVIGSKSRRPTREGYGGAASLVDIEPNDSKDKGSNIGLYDLDCDFTGAWYRGGAGNCVNIQNPTKSNLIFNVTAANITVKGGSPSDTTSRPLSNGLVISGPIPNLKVVNVRVENAGQTCLQVYSLQGGLFQDVSCINSGGGGNKAVMFIESNDPQLVRLQVYDAPDNKVSTDPRILFRCGGRISYTEKIPVVVDCPSKGTDRARPS